MGQVYQGGASSANSKVDYEEARHGEVLQYVGVPDALEGGSADDQRRVASQLRGHLKQQLVVRVDPVVVLCLSKEVSQPHAVLLRKGVGLHEVVELVHQILEGRGVGVEGGENAA